MPQDERAEFGAWPVPDRKSRQGFMASRQGRGREPARKGGGRAAGRGKGELRDWEEGGKFRSVVQDREKLHVKIPALKRDC